MNEKKLKILIVEDDFVSRRILKQLLIPYGECDMAKDGEEAVHAFYLGWEEQKPYDLICMDVMMPEMDGQEALQKIRGMEVEMGIIGSQEVKVIMVTALDDMENIIKAFHDGGATSYIVKPISNKNLINEMKNLGLIQ
ncbi:MAG: response regulator [Desulfobacteraceae bacterium]|jgi:two-component system chemotaxis response regulator CheY